MLRTHPGSEGSRMSRTLHIDDYRHCRGIFIDSWPTYEPRFGGDKVLERSRGEG